METDIKHSFLTDADMATLIAFRHELHRYPEISGEEYETAKRVINFVTAYKPDQIVTDLGGTGVAVIFNGDNPGPTVMLRCELDALPITETGDVAYKSLIAGKGHMCGHDGHMATIAAMALGLSRQRPQRGRVVLLFQPAEETGAGALAVLEDPKFETISPDISFSLHNKPGYELGFAGLKEGPVNCASRGIRLHLTGRTAHASTPDSGKSPMMAIARLMPALVAMNGSKVLDTEFTMVTVTHATLGEPTFGVAPGDAEIWATLRTLLDSRMAQLCAEVEKLAKQISHEEQLELTIAYDDVFLNCENSLEAVKYLQRAMDDEGVPYGPSTLPMHGSEDFGRFRSVGPAAMFFLGSGKECAALHSPDYDFPDELIGIGSAVFMRVVRNILG